MIRERKKKALLRNEFTRVAERITDEQLQKLLSGEASLSVTVRMKKMCVSEPTHPSMAEIREDFNDVRERLTFAKSRDDCAILADYVLPEKADLFAFAKFLELAVQWSESRRRLREKIVEATAGARIDAEIIRGGY